MTGLSWWRRHLTAWADALTQHRQSLYQRVTADCSCTGPTTVVVHERGTYCGDRQQEAVADAIAAAGPYPEAMAAAALEALNPKEMS